jgi:hypothetical protein
MPRKRGAGPAISLVKHERRFFGPVSDFVDYSSFRRLVFFPRGESVLRRLRSSFKRAALLIRLTDLEDQTDFPSCTQHQSRIGSQILLQASAQTIHQAAEATPPESVFGVFQGSFRNNITQHRTSSLRATATIAFFFRVFWPLVSRS